MYFLRKRGVISFIYGIIWVNVKTNLSQIKLSGLALGWGYGF